MPWPRSPRRRLDVANLAEFEGSAVQLLLCGGQEVAFVGGGNSAARLASMALDDRAREEPSRPRCRAIWSIASRICRT
jgi:hypothetical protein